MEIEVKIIKDEGTKVIRFGPAQPPVTPFIRIDYETVDVIGNYGFVKQESTGYARVEIFGRLLEGE